MRVGSLRQEDPLEMEIATHSSIPAWEIPWTGEPGGLYSPWGPKRVRCDLATKVTNQQHQLAGKPLCILRRWSQSRRT